MTRSLRSRLTLMLLTGAAFALLTSPALAQRKLGTIGPPPRQTPQRQASAEAVPPLPLPATPLRRSEPKAEPKGPLFIGKLMYGTDQDYMPNPGDVENLLRHVRSQLDQWYSSQLFGINELVAMHKKGQVCQIPMLYITGYQTFKLSDDERAALRSYLLDGGTIVADAALGSPEFTESFKAEVAGMFPQRKIVPLQIDHPIFRGYYQYSNVHYFTITQGIHSKQEGPPMMLGMNLAARTAVIISPYDMTCGWDEFYAPTAPRIGDAKPQPTMAMTPADAIRMGINIVAYVSAQRRFGKVQSQTVSLVGEQTQKRAAIAIAQLKHQGDWNPDPNSLNQLVRLVAQRTSMPVEFQVKPVDADIEQLADTPIVIMAGLDEPKMNDKQVDALRRHIQAGGFLFINNTSGFALFDREARALIARVVPDQKLQTVPPEHPMLHALYDAKELRDAGTLQARPAQLEAVFVNGKAVIVYSPNDTLGMLKGVHDPYANAYDAESARRLALNVMCYAVQR